MRNCVSCFCVVTRRSQRKKPRIGSDAGLECWAVSRRCLEAGLDAERECALAVAVGQHLFADFAESGHILREGVFNTSTIVGAEANSVVALHINNFRVVRIQLRNTIFKRPAGEGETEHGVCAEFVGDIENVSTVGTEIPHGESVVLEVVVERSFESNVVGHEILTANIKARAFNLRAVDQTYADFFGALLGEGRSAQAGNSDKEEKLFHLRNVELRE